MLRREVKDEVEFVTITMFDLLDAVKQFAGEDYEIGVILPEANRLLSRFAARSAHYGDSVSARLGTFLAIVVATAQFGADNPQVIHVLAAH